MNNFIGNRFLSWQGIIRSHRHSMATNDNAVRASNSQKYTTNGIRQQTLGNRCGFIIKVKSQSFLVAIMSATFISSFGLNSSNADDTDIYLNLNTGSSDKPMIMLSLDYRSSLGNTVCNSSEYDPNNYTQFPNGNYIGDGIESSCAQLINEEYLPIEAIRENGNYSSLEIYRAVLKKVMDHDLGGATIAESALFGIMMNHENTNNCDADDYGCSNGGFILSKFRDLSIQTDYDFFFDALESIPIPNLTWNQVVNGTNACSAYGSNTGEHQYQGAELFFELFRYLTGQGIYFGHHGFDDFGTDNNENLDNGAGLLSAPYNPSNLSCRVSPVWDVSAEDAGFYKSPLEDLDPNGCGASLYTFNFMFQVSNQEEDANCGILSSKDSGGMEGIAGNANNCKVSSSGNAGTFGEVLEYLSDVDLADGTFGPGAVNLSGKQNITSYFFVPPTKVNQTTNAYANAGGTTSAIGMDLSDIDVTLNTIIDILEEILSVSTTFVSPTLPSNVFNRTDLLNQVYIAIFKADEDNKPRWTGNLKRLFINDSDPSNPFLAGDDGSGGVSSSSAVADDGRIKPTTLTVWTHPEDVPAAPDVTADYALGKDGRSTVHGGAGGNIPGYRETDAITGQPGTTNPASATSDFSSRKIFTEPDVMPINSAVNLRPFHADINTAIAFLEIGDGGTDLNLLSDDHKQIKKKMWQQIMPICPDDPTKCGFYNEASVADKTEGINRLLDILAYGRGYNSYEETAGEFDGVKRDWILGDPLHSRPVAINYGGANAANQIVRIAITTNDGFLHFFRESDGVEEWAFTPRSVTGVQRRLQQNTLGSPPHPYTLDSNVIAMTIDADFNGVIEPSTGDQAYLFTGMRRGGKFYYALDATDYTTPKMLWSISNEDADFKELGQSWSEMQPIYISYNDGTSVVTKNALIFSGGYNGDDDADGIDLGKDQRDNTNPAFTGSNDDEGNAIFIIDAETGELIWKAIKAEAGVTTGPDASDERLYYHEELDDSIPAKISVSNATTPGNPYHDRGYVGDTGGRVWRIDFNGTDRALWKVSMLADLGRHNDPGDQTHDRRFFHSADTALSKDDTGSFDAVIIASGNRANPLSSATQNYLYMIKDRNVGIIPTTDPQLTHVDLMDLTDNCLQDGDDSDCSDSLTDLTYGWRMELENCTDEGTTSTDAAPCGEKGLSQPLVLFGNIITNTYIPALSQGSGAVCAPSEGSGQTYILSLQNATAVSDLNASNNAGEITLDRSYRLDSGGIPSDPVLAGQYDVPTTPFDPLNDDPTIQSCKAKLAVLLPDLNIDLFCGIGNLKTYWYTTNPDAQF